MFWGMIGLSAALHGLALISVPGDGFRAQPPDQDNQFVQTIKMIKIGTRPPANAPSPPIERKAVKRPAEPAPEVPSIEETQEEVEETDETAPREVMREDGDAEEGDRGYDEEQREDEGGEGRVTEAAPESGAMTDREHEALLAYIKDFIDKNLEYPPMARRRNVEGIVGVHFEIERNGGFAAVTVDHSSGSSILDKAAVSLVKKMHPLENLTLNRTLALRVNIAYKLTE